MSQDLKLEDALIDTWRTNHRGQIVLLARQLGHRLPNEVAAGLWQWTKRAKEARSG